MNVFQELRQRRVPQITSGYIVVGWGVLQFLAFLESRMAISPHLVNLIGLALLLLLPSLITLAWVHGRPGKDTWGRTPKVVISANFLAASLMLAFLFSGRDLGAMTRTVEVEDENGAVTERVVPKNEYRRRLLVFYPENTGGEADDWARETAAYLLALDLEQDAFLDLDIPLSMPGTMIDAGSEDGHGLSRQLKRKIAKDANIKYYLTGNMSHQEGQWQQMTEMHESESGKVVAQRTQTATSLFDLVDLVSRQVREDLGIPAAHLDESPDLPVAELTSSDLEAVASHVRGVVSVTHFNDWDQGEILLNDAVARDPDFAIAQALLASIHHTMGNAEKASKAISAAMKNLYRVPERLSFMIKAQYYFNEKLDADKAMAVVQMWSQLYPNDVSAYEQQATFHFIRQDIPQAIAAYEKILSIDPTRVMYLEDLADLNKQVGNLVAAEGYLKRYVERFPARARGYEKLSDFYSATGRLDEAREALAQAQLLDPENEALALSLIDLDIKVGKYKEVGQALDQLFDEAENDRDRLRIIGRQLKLAALLGQPDQVIDRIDALYATLKKVQNPLQANLVYSMGLPLVSMAGRPEEALVRLVEVKSLIPEPYTDLAGVGEAWVFAELGKLEEARASLAPAVEIVETLKFETFRSSIALIEGMIFEQEGDLEQAVSAYRQALEKALQVEPMFRVRLARALRFQGEAEQAMAVLEEGLKVEPMHPEIQLEVAHLLHRKGNTVQAQKHLNIALAAWVDAGPDYPPAREARKLADGFTTQ
jgi:tetratricopeptide (TPR) repeat protein